MKVLMIPPASAGLVNGGVRRQVLKTAQGLRALEVDVHLFDPSRLWDPARFDVVHLFQAGHEMLSLSRLVKHPTVRLVVSPVLFSRHSARRMRRWLWLESMWLQRFGGVASELMVKKWVCEKADLLLPNTPAEERWIQEAFGIAAKRMQWVPNGVDVQFAEADSRLFEEKTGWDEVTLFVGHIVSKRKNLLKVIERYRAVDVVQGGRGTEGSGVVPGVKGTEGADGVQGPPLVLIGQTEGGGAYGEACRRAIEQNPDVVALGPLQADDPLLASAYRAARVFLLPSLFETPGIAAMEAAMAGAIPVVTAYGGTKDVFGEHALYVEPTDTKGILKALAQAYSMDGSSEHTQAEVNTQLESTNLQNPIQQHLAAHYSWEIVAQKTLKAYKTV